MNLRRVGSSGLQVSELGLGTMTWGRDTPAEESLRLLERYLEAGGNLVDTAAAYGAGDSERTIGTGLGSVVAREDVVIATKSGFRVRNGKRIVDTSRRSMINDLEGSLERLGTDYVDLWQIHTWGAAPLEETLSALDHAVSAGMARYVGLSNFIGWQTAQAATWQRADPSRAAIISTQIEYSLLARRAEVEILGAVAAFDMGFFPWSPLGRGVLTGKYRAGVPRNSRGASRHFAWFVEPYLQPRSRTVVEAVAKAAEGLELTPLQISLLWVRDAPLVTAPILGCRTVQQLDECLSVVGDRLPSEITIALDDVTGGPNTAR